MIERLRSILGTTLIFLLAFTGYCQQDDAGLWISLNLEKKLSQTVNLSYSQELRLAENISETSVIFGDLGADYRITRTLKISGHYRWLLQRRLDDTYSRYNRFYFDLSYRNKFKPLGIIIRERIQSEYSLFNSGDNVNPELYSRTKATVKLDFDTRLSPFSYVELFHPLNFHSDTFFDKFRASAGLEWQISQRHLIDLGYMIQRKYKAVPERDFVIEAGYFYTF